MAMSLVDKQPLMGVSAWLLGCVLTLAMMATFAFQYTLGVLAPAFTTELGLSRLGLGGITATYYLTAALASSTLGHRVGLISSRAGTFLLFGLSASACLFAAALATAWALFLAAGIAGIAAGLSNPVTNIVIAARAGRRGALVGIKQAGVQLAAVLVGIGLPPLAAGFGWRAAMVLLALILLSIGLGLTAAVPLGGPYGSADTDRRAALPRAVRWLCGYAFFMGAGVATLTTYLVLFAHEQIALTAGTAGLLLATLGFAGGVSRVVSSVLAERGQRLGLWMGCAAGVAVLGVALLASTTNPLIVWIGVGIIGMSGAAWNGVVMLAVLRISSAHQAGHATGVVLTGFFAGLSLAPPLFGAIVDATQNYTYGWLLTGSCFAVAGMLTLTMARRAPLMPTGTGTYETVGVPTTSI